MIQNLIIEVEKQGNHHPDLSLRGFYRSLSQLIETHQKTNEYIQKSLEKRNDIEISHLTNLIYRAIQYVLIYEHNKKDMGDYTDEIWTDVIIKLMEDDKTHTIILDKTLNENTQTNIYQRYAGPKAILSKIFGTKKINLVDIGCSQNLGLMGMEINYPFIKVHDHTENKELSTLIEKDIKIESCIGVDIEDPRGKTEWALACRFYPKELKLFDSEDQMIRYFKKKSKKTKFMQESVLNISKTWKEKSLPKVDAAITSLVLYQLQDDLKNSAIEEIKKILKDDGVLIINDFVKVNSHIKWNVPWFENGQSNYRTVVLKKKNGKFSEPLEYIIWDSGRCLEAHPGKDFDLI